MFKQDIKLAKRVWKNYSKYRRLLAAKDFDYKYVRCVTCGAIKQIKKMQLGHYYHRGNGPYTDMDFNEINTNPQCVSCNYYKSANLTKYAEYLTFQYGKEIVEKLSAMNTLKKIVSNEELKQINKFCLEKIKKWSL